MQRCLCVSHDRESCKVDSTDQDAVAIQSRVHWPEVTCIKYGRHLVNMTERHGGDAGYRYQLHYNFNYLLVVQPFIHIGRTVR